MAFKCFVCLVIVIVTYSVSPPVAFMLYFAHPPVVCYVYVTVIVCQLESPGCVYDFFVCTPRWCGMYMVLLSLSMP